MRLMQGTFLKANYINLFLMILTNMSLRIGNTCMAFSD